MSIKKGYAPPAKPSTDSKFKNHIQLTSTSLSFISVSRGNEQASPPTQNERKISASDNEFYVARERRQKEEKKRMQENEISRIRVECEKCRHSDYGHAVDDCIHVTCAFWGRRNGEMLLCLGVGKGATDYVNTVDLNQRRDDT